jgi:hypothetical protein
MDERSACCLETFNNWCGKVAHPVPKNATLVIQPDSRGNNESTMPVQFSRNFKNWNGNLVIRIVKNPNFPTISMPIAKAS